jgi:hypothetical protein
VDLRTLGVIGICVVVLITWDIYVAFFNDIPNSRDTESGIMRRIGSRFVGIPIMWGVLGYHFWGPSIQSMNHWTPLYMALVVAVLSLFHFFMRRFVQVPMWSAFIYFLVGIPLGVLWSQ